MATQTRVPTGNGATTDFTAVGAATVWEACDDPVGSPDDSTTYGLLAAANGSHYFTFSPPSIPAGSTINSVTVVSRNEAVGSSWTSSNNVRVGGANFSSATSTVSTTVGFVDHSRSWLTNPATTLAWTVDEINGTAGSNNLEQFGTTVTGNTTAGDEAQVTQVYMIIDYTEGAGGSKNLTLLGVG